MVLKNVRRNSMMYVIELHLVPYVLAVVPFQLYRKWIAGPNFDRSALLEAAAIPKVNGSYCQKL